MQVADDVLKTAEGFCKSGAIWIHMVDLDGALQGKPINANIVQSVCESTSLKVEIGGGIRTMADINLYSDMGVSRIVLGSIALHNKAIVKEAIAIYGEKIAIGIDARDGFVRTSGWLEVENVYFTDLAVEMQNLGVRTIIYTDISKDGMLTGPNYNQLTELQNHFSGNIIASGGIKDIENIKHLEKMNLYGAICGKSIYAGTLDLKEALEIS
jgi:phosphoribosylformimino-5-aminoimidazole carboxamide ribotide isomerase